MKYLKRYNEGLDSSEEMVQYSKDILSDIEDNGFTTEVSSDLVDGVFQIYICKFLDAYGMENTSFKFGEIKDACDRINTIANDYGYVLTTHIFDTTNGGSYIVTVPYINEEIYYAEFAYHKRHV
jgi:hypothetical protein